MTLESRFFPQQQGPLFGPSRFDRARIVLRGGEAGCGEIRLRNSSLAPDYNDLIMRVDSGVGSREPTVQHLSSGASRIYFHHFRSLTLTLSGHGAYPDEDILTIGSDDIDVAAIFWTTYPQGWVPVPQKVFLYGTGRPGRLSEPLPAC